MAEPSLRRHSPDFQQRILSYGDVWTREDVETLMEVLEGFKQRGPARLLGALPADEALLSRLIEKLALLDERLSLAVGSILGLREVPQSLVAKIPPELLASGNASLVVKTLNRLYESGELSSLDYLALMGHLASGLRVERIDDPETLANVGRAVDEVFLVFRKSALPLLPEPHGARGVARSALFVRAPEVPGLLLAPALAVLLAPLMAYASLALLARSRYPGLIPIRRALLTPGTVASVLVSPEDAISAYWAAVGLLSRIVPRDPWDTHREYVAKVERELGSRDAVSAFKALSEEYEGVRFAGERGSLTRGQLAELVERVEKGLWARELPRR